MPIDLWCAPGVFLAQVHEDVVVLDVKADRYDCLLDAADRIVIGPDGSLRTSDQDVAHDLLAAGIGSADRPPAPRRAQEPAQRELATPSSPPTLARIEAGLSLARATLAFRGRTLGELIDAARRPSPPLTTADDLLGERVAAARAALPWVPFEGECLQRAFQLKCLLARRGLATDWVFGVRTWPFAAHCWLQVGDVVVADSLERVRRYTPIMAA